MKTTLLFGESKGLKVSGEKMSENIFIMSNTTKKTKKIIIKRYLSIISNKTFHHHHQTHDWMWS